MTRRVPVYRWTANPQTLKRWPVSLYADSGNGAASKPVLLKFAQYSERAHTVATEATAPTLAAELGMRVPEHEAEWLY